MFDTLTTQFKSIANKIRFSDDEKSLKNAIDELKKALLKNDIYHKTAKEILLNVESKTKQYGIGKSQFIQALQESLQDILKSSKSYGFSYAPTPPTIALMCGLQGSGKTTTSAKLGLYLKARGKKILLVPCDLQRLAAITQLEQLGAQAEIEVYKSEEKDVIKVAQGALAHASKNAFDVVILDSAGRLSIDTELMAELKSLKNAINPHEILYVADALSGQEGVRNAESFNNQIGINGVILTKFDSDSKGGVALSIAHQIGIPLRFIGNGEKLADFEIFLPDRIVSRLLGAGDIEGLAEKTSTILNPKEAKDVAKKIKKGQFGLEDFIAQIENLKKLGNLGSLASMIPGMGNIAGALKNVDLDKSSEVKNIRAMLNSMTKKERENTDLLNGSRRQRIAKGSGLEVSDINRILKQFDLASKMAKKVGQKGGMNELMNMMNKRR